MAVKKLPTSIGLVLHVDNGTDSNGKKKYAKKSFSGVKADADPANILEVGVAISAVLAKEAEGCYLSETSLLANEAEQ